MGNLFQKFKKREPTKEEFAKHGSNRDWNVDLVPKFLMASGELVKLLIHTKVTRYLDFKVIDGSYVAKGKSGKRFTVSKVPSSAGEALASPLMGFFQKNKLRNFLSWLQNVQPDSKVAGKLNLETSTTADVFKWFGLDGNSQSFIGHAMALQNSDDYLTQNCMPTLMALKLYGNSLARHGGSPYLYPMYGLGGLAEGFARLCAVFGGTFMLHQPIDELLTDSSGKVIGVRAGDQVATAPHIIGDPSYFPKEKIVSGKKVVRSICFLNHPIAPKGKYIAIVSTEVETDNPLRELAAGIQLLGKIEERFDSVEDGLSGKAGRAADNCHISASYDGTSHFQSVAADVVRIYKAVTGEDIDMSIDAKLEE